MKRIYISGKITGTNDYMERFKRGSVLAKEYFKDSDFDECEIVNPSLLDNVLPSSVGNSCYMDVCFAILRYCHSIFMLDGWESSKGAKAEMAYAVCLGLTVYYESEARKSVAEKFYKDMSF